MALLAASGELVAPVVLVTLLVEDIWPMAPVELVDGWLVLVALAVVPDELAPVLFVDSPGSSLVQQKSPSPSSPGQWQRLDDRSRSRAGAKCSMTNSGRLPRLPSFKKRSARSH